MHTGTQLADFKKAMSALHFYEQDGGLIRSNRDLGYDNDCSDDERNDGFYEEKSAAFRQWADPIQDLVDAAAKKHSITIKMTTSAEYGDIYVHIKE